MNEYLINLSYILIIGILFFYIIKSIKDINFTKEYLTQKKLTSMSINEIAEVLNYIIDSEFNFYITIPFEAKEIKRISNFEKSLATINNGIIDKIDPNIYIAVEANGLRREFVSSFISRVVTLKLIQYISDNNAGVEPKDNNTTERLIF